MLTNPIISSVIKPNIATAPPQASAIPPTEPSLVEASSSGGGSAAIQTGDEPCIKRIMIICPKNTIQNWIKEYHRFTPEDLV
jgi:hypothetical protein